MDIFGVGPLEVLLVLLLALVLFGPKDIAGHARSAGRFLNRLYKSEGWRTMAQASTALRNLPNRLAREAELDQLEQVRRELNSLDRPAPAPPASGMAAWTPGPSGPTPPAGEPPVSEPE